MPKFLWITLRACGVAIERREEIWEKIQFHFSAFLYFLAVMAFLSPLAFLEWYVGR